MITIRTEPGAATIRLSRDELHLLNNALNEVCHALTVDFPTRMGAERDEAARLLQQIHALIEQI